MKKLLNAVLLIVVVLTMAACGTNQKEDKRLKQSIEEKQAELPVSLGAIGDITDIRYDETDKMVSLSVTVNEQIRPVKVLMDNPEQPKKMFGLGMSSEEAKSLMTMISDAGASMSVRYKGSKTGDEFKFTLSSEELAELASSEMSDSERSKLYLEYEISTTNAICPLDIGNGLTLKNIKIENNNFVYTYDVNENLADLEVIIPNMPKLKQDIKNQYSSAQMATDLQLLLDAGYGVIYRYEGNITGKRVDVTISHSELEDL